MEGKKVEVAFNTHKPHLVCIPYPGQGHINCMMQFAKLLHSKGFHITFVHTEFNHSRLLKSSGPDSSLSCPDGFGFETIPDGLPPSDDDTRDVPTLSESIRNNKLLAPFRQLVAKLNNSADTPRVSCIVSDVVMTFPRIVAEELGIPWVVLCTYGACGLMGFLYSPEVITRGLGPLKDEVCLSNGSLNTAIDWVPGVGMIRLKDMPSYIRTTDSDDVIMLNFLADELQNTLNSSAIVINTFDDLEEEIVTASRNLWSRVFTVGPLTILCHRIPNKPFESFGSSLWREEATCMEWLDGQEANSVIYVNFGSTTSMSAHQLSEFAWGIANSNCPFLWVIRSNLVTGDHAVLPREFMENIKGRGFLASWCQQEEVLLHPSVGGFLTHCGWNSTMESISGGVPMICWPFSGDQPTNRHYICEKWGIGIEIDRNAKRDGVERAVKELMRGEKGKEMRKKVMNLKENATNATEGGSSYHNLDKLVNQILKPKE